LEFINHTHEPEEREIAFQRYYSGYGLDDTSIYYYVCKYCGVEMEEIGDEWVPKYEENPELNNNDGKENQ